MRRLFAGPTLILGVVAALTLSACGTSEPETGGTSATGGPEKAALTIGVVAVPDAAPIQIAVDKGFFKEEGLDVKISVETGGAAATPKLVAGQLDAMLGNYVALFLAQQAGAGKFKVVADSYQAAPDNFVIMTKGDNTSINTAADLAGKKIAVNTLNAIGTLAVTATAKVAGVTINENQYVPMPLPDMGAALETGTVDAIWVAEPFISANAKAGAKKVADSMAGPLENFPIAGWVMTEKFTTENPKTVAAFQRALAKAQNLAASDRKVVEEALPKYTKIDAATAAVIALGTYSTSLSEARLQRVADTLTEYKMIPAGFDVKALMAPTAAAQ